MTVLISFDGENYASNNMVNNMVKDIFQHIIIEGYMSKSEMVQFTEMVTECTKEEDSIILVYTKNTSLPDFALEAYTWLNDSNLATIFIAGNI